MDRIQTYTDYGRPIEFRICPQENQYVDLKRSLLKIKLKVTKADGTDVGPDDKI